MNKEADKINIEFRKLPIPPEYGKVIHDIYHVVENGHPHVMEHFRSLPSDTRDDIKDLICRMATKAELKSPKIRNSLRGYNYGEIRPLPHRFFFFRKHGNSIIFFSYAEKKKKSFNNKFYKELNKEKARYERAFEEFVKRD